MEGRLSLPDRGARAAGSSWWTGVVADALVLEGWACVIACEGCAGRARQSSRFVIRAARQNLVRQKTSVVNAY